MRILLLFFSFFFISNGFSKFIDIENLSAKTAILINGDTGAVLYEKDAYSLCYPGSTTKVATALFILERKQTSLQKMLMVSEEALRMKPRHREEGCLSYWQESDGTKMGLLKGEILSVEALLYGLLMVSANDAANVLAEGICGSVEAFLIELNDYLREIGFGNTHFTNPHGLHDVQHITCAVDMALIFQRALQLPAFRKIMEASTYSRLATNKQPAYEMLRNNSFLSPSSRYYYPHAIAGKTGYTKAAQNTLVTAAQHEGRLLIAALFGCEKRHTRYQDAKALFDAAFAESKKRHLFFPPSSSFSCAVEGGTKSLEAMCIQEISIDYFPSEAPDVKAWIEWQIPPLPIRKGQKVGYVQIQDSRGHHWARESLFAKSEVHPTFWFSLKKIWRAFF